MSRSGYHDDSDDSWAHIRWRGAVTSAMNGKRGQAFLKEMLAALDAMPEKRLITHELEAVKAHESGVEVSVCAIGAVGLARNMDMSQLDPEDPETVAGTFNIADALTREIVYMNDEGAFYPETPEQRWERMREWVARRINP